MSNTPQIRFAGFTDAWEQRKVGDTYNVTRGYVLAAPKTSPIKTDEMPYPVYSSQTKDEGLMGYYNEYLYENAITWTTDGANAGTVNYRAGKFYCTNVCGVLLSDKGYANKAAAEALNMVAWKWVSHVGNPKLMNNVMAEIEISLPPTLQEQDKISEFLESLDNLITLHQHKCDALQKFKKSMLQKVFPQNGESVPEIRFAGFTNAWEQRKLSDMVERVTRKNENLESELPLTISAQYGLIDQNEFFDKRIASRDVSGYYLLKKGEFAYNKSTSSDAPWGAVKRLDRYEMGVLSTLYIVFALKKDGNIDSDFLVSYYDTDCWHKGVQAIAAEGARNHGLLNITPADYFETVLTVPSNVKEQHQIGTFFAKLDNIITLHQRKLETLQKMKKSLLQKMFV